MISLADVFARLGDRAGGRDITYWVRGMIWVLDADRPSDALRCAAEVQNAIAESNAPFPPDRRIEFRKPLQLALASSDCLMRILRPIVLPKPCSCRQVSRRR